MQAYIRMSHTAHTSTILCKAVMQPYSFLLLEHLQVCLAKYEYCHILFECVDVHNALVS